MDIQQVKDIVTANGLSAHEPQIVIEKEKFILHITADHNDADYETESTTFLVDSDFDLVELLNVLKVLKKLKRVRHKHIDVLYHDLTEEDVNVLFEYDRKRDSDIVDIEEYSLFDINCEYTLKYKTYDYDSEIRSWFPDSEYERHGSIRGNHSLISIELQYNDGNGNLLNIVV